jgi:hypothetical protein
LSSGYVARVSPQPFIEHQQFGDSRLTMALSADRSTVTISLPPAVLGEQELQRLIVMLGAKRAQMKRSRDTHGR